MIVCEYVYTHTFVSMWGGGVCVCVCECVCMHVCVSVVMVHTCGSM